ncbi:hypothetical protein FSY45_24840 [Comamonas sp. Z1]|uniref:hypothetical protein n=1 Tax=Comamonas sp. Z1 TaxID=2601246 RepID=UPI0011E78866|nr:hypothetical protein [Comamonas sp. Z1]TYK70292.1 hypothetical protein FSY45_24840 [Comamonas sp. Z1]
MKRSPNVPKHPKGWRFAGAAHGFTFWQNGPMTYRITPVDEPDNVLATEKALGLCMHRAAVQRALANMPQLEGSA